MGFALQEIVSFLQNFDCLPSPVPLKNYMAAKLADPEISLGDAVAVVKLDPCSLGRVLKVANSISKRSHCSVSSVDNAVSLLGLTKIKSVVSISHTVVPSQNETEIPFALERFWKHSLAVAVISESIAKQMIRYKTLDTEAVYAAGLLHDTGKIALCSVKPELVTKSVIKCSEKPFCETESEQYSHSMVGGMVAAAWKLPKDIKTAIEYHHAPSVQDDLGYLSSIVHVADVAAHIVGFATIEDECVNPLDADAFSCLGIQMESLRVIASSALSRIKTIESQVEQFR